MVTNSLLSRGVGASPRAAGLLLLVVRRRSTNVVPTAALVLAKAAPRVVGVKQLLPRLPWSNSVQSRSLSTSAVSSSTGGVGGSGDSNDPSKSALAAVIDIKAKQEWTKLVTETSLGRKELTPDLLGVLLDLSDKRSTSLASALDQAGIDTIGSLLTAAEKILENADGSFVATGMLASIDAASLQVIAALRDKTKGKRKTLLRRFNPTH